MSWEEIRRRERSDTIEHILPQTPTSSYWRERFNARERRLLMDDLGNLCLTKDNASYSNKPFPEKKGVAGSGKPCYAESPLFMERELATLDNWDPMQLVARRQRLVNWALDRWRVEFDDPDIVSVEPDDETEDDLGLEETEDVLET